MNEIEDPVPAPEAAPTQVAPAPDWKPLPTRAATTSMFGGLSGGLFLGIAPAFVAGMLLGLRAFEWTRGQAFVFAAAIWLLAGAFGTLLAYWRWKSSAWKLDDTGLRFRRGYVWHREILVPRTRVQHLDIERGPIERHYGLATLIVHTAGTRHHALRIPGLADADAVSLRDALVPVSAMHDDVL